MGSLGSEGSREAGSNVEYFAIKKRPSKYRLAAQISENYSVFDRPPKSLIKFSNDLVGLLTEPVRSHVSTNRFTIPPNRFGEPVRNYHRTEGTRLLGAWRCHTTPPASPAHTAPGWRRAYLYDWPQNVSVETVAHRYGIVSPTAVLAPEN